MRRPASTASRRSFLAAVGGIVVTPTVLQASRAAAKSDSVTFTGHGGSFQDALVKAVFTPFTEETGIKVNIVPAPDMAKIKAMELMGNVEWDVFNGDGTWAAAGSKLGFWEKLDLSKLDLQDLAIQPTSEIATFDVYPEGIAWDPKKYGPGKHPTDFSEFFDLNKFPGRRAMRPFADGTLEIALLADGVAPKDMYPLDLDRAFKALDRIKSHTVWPTGTPQSVSFLQTGEVDFSITYSNRVKATTEPGGGVPLAFSFEQCVIFTDPVTILKGAPNKEGAMKLIAYFLRPEVQTRLENLVGLVPVSKKGATMLSPEALKWQPDLKSPKHVTTNDAYWTDNFEPLNRRFKEWMLS